MYQVPANTQTLKAAMAVIDVSIARRLVDLPEAEKEAFYEDVENILSSATSKKQEVAEGTAVDGISALKTVWSALQGRLAEVNEAIVQVGLDTGIDPEKESPQFKEAFENFQKKEFSFIPQLPFDPPAVIPPVVAKADIYALLGAWSILIEGLLQALPSTPATKASEGSDNDLVH